MHLMVLTVHSVPFVVFCEVIYSSASTFANMASSKIRPLKTDTIGIFSVASEDKDILRSYVLVCPR